ncbi:MAG: phosphatase [Atopobiaceae bacterium]|nr:phosphatase [Atopobiaceae bacterium]
MARVACIDIGTVTCRLALAEVEHGEVVSLDKTSTICELGVGVDQTGLLDGAAIGRVVDCAGGYLGRIREFGAERLVCTMTSAARDAANSSELVDQLARMGITAQVIPGDMEGRLTFLGVARAVGGGHVFVADNGGGSTELVDGVCDADSGVADVAWVRSVDIGCRRVTDRCLRNQYPPTAEGIEAAHELCRERFEAALAERRTTLGDAPSPDKLVTCGGTVTSIVAVKLGLVPYDSSRVHLARLSRRDVRTVEDRMAALPLDQIETIPGLQAKRAKVILGGVVAIAELMDVTGFDELVVSESDLLFGLAIACAEGTLGTNWE